MSRGFGKSVKEIEEVYGYYTTEAEARDALHRKLKTGYFKLLPGRTEQDSVVQIDDGRYEYHVYNPDLLQGNPVDDYDEV